MAVEIWTLDLVGIFSSIIEAYFAEFPVYDRGAIDAFRLYVVLKHASLQLEVHTLLELASRLFFMKYSTLYARALLPQ